MSVNLITGNSTVTVLSVQGKPLNHCPQPPLNPAQGLMTLGCNTAGQEPRKANRQDAELPFQLLTWSIAFLTLLWLGCVCSYSCSAGLGRGRKASSGPAHYPTLGYGNRWSFACLHTISKDAGNLNVARPGENLWPRCTKVPAFQWLQEEIPCLKTSVNLVLILPFPLHKSTIR